MNGKSESGKNKNVWQNIWEYGFVRPWPYWVGGVLLGIINILYVFLTGRTWSITKGLVRSGVWVLNLLGINTDGWQVWRYYDYIVPVRDHITWSNLGIITGALLAILLARQFKWKRIRYSRQLWLALIGGYFMGYGARVASGCNIGGLYSSISSLALNGWIYLPFVIVGIVAGSLVLKKWFVR